MTDITEQLAERTRLLHVAEDEIDDLRARVAMLEADENDTWQDIGDAILTAIAERGFEHTTDIAIARVAIAAIKAAAAKVPVEKSKCKGCEERDKIIERMTAALSPAGVRVDRRVSPVLVGCEESQTFDGIAQAVVMQWANTR